MREQVRDWGSDLSDDDFACAIATAGIGIAMTARVDWSWSGTPARPAAELAALWHARGNATRGLRATIRTPEVDAWPYLARPAVGLSGLLIATAPSRAQPERWPWPWRVVDASANARFSAALSQARPNPRTLLLVEPDERAPAGVLVVEGPIHDAYHLLDARFRRQRAHVVVVAGTLEPEARTESRPAEALIRKTGASIVISGAPDAPDVLFRLLHELADELAHDHPIDRALLMVARRLHLDPPIVHGDPAMVERARLSARAIHIAGRLFRPDGAKSLEGFESVPLDVTNLQWDSEGQGATVLARLQRDQQMRDDDYAEQAKPRYLQANLTLGGATEPTKTIAPDRCYDVAVRIGDFDPRWLAVPGPIADPAAGTEVDIDIILSERNLLPAPLRTTITMPPRGATKPATFQITTHPDVARLELRVTAIHRNRVLQSGILRAVIDGIDPLVFEVDAIGRHQLGGLDYRRPFDAAIVANHTAAGEAGFVGAVPDGVGYITLAPDALADLTQALGRSIATIAVDPAKYRKLRDPGTIDILRDLAARGSAFYDLLVEHNEIGKGLLAAERIQIVAARAGTFLPLELAYSHPAPDNDKVDLCEHAEEALDTGSCPGACGTPSSARICPLGFWSLSRVIERQAHKPQHNQLAQRTDYQLVYAEPPEPPEDPPAHYTEAVTPQRSRIERPASVVLAVSDKIDQVEPTTSQTLRDALALTFGGANNVLSATDWTQWVAQVTAAARPNLLMLLPHHKDGALEIGTKQDLRALYVRKPHVTGNVPPPPSPIVVLLGCETAMAQIPYESFVAVFRKYDASVVISTIATVLGRDAAPVAAALAQGIIDLHGQGGGYVGDAMVKLRRKMLLDGKAMVLALTAYGDADWKLAPA